MHHVQPPACSKQTLKAFCTVKYCSFVFQRASRALVSPRRNENKHLKSSKRLNIGRQETDAFSKCSQPRQNTAKCSRLQPICFGEMARDMQTRSHDDAVFILRVARQSFATALHFGTAAPELFQSFGRLRVFVCCEVMLAFEEQHIARSEVTYQQRVHTSAWRRPSSVGSQCPPR